MLRDDDFPLSCAGSLEYRMISIQSFRPNPFFTFFLKFGTVESPPPGDILLILLVFIVNCETVFYVIGYRGSLCLSTELYTVALTA